MFNLESEKMVDQTYQPPIPSASGLNYASNEGSDITLVPEETKKQKKRNRRLVKPCFFMVDFIPTHCNWCKF